jgi:hypothetical protein
MAYGLTKYTQHAEVRYAVSTLAEVVGLAVSSAREQ